MLKEYDGSETYELVLVIDGILDDEQVDRAVGILNYALKPLAGEEAILTGEYRKNGKTYIQVDWDSTKSGSDDIGSRMDLIMYELDLYIKDGTPVRKTNRSGPKGTRLIEGLGISGASLMYEVPDSYEYEITISIKDENRNHIDNVNVKITTDYEINEDVILGLVDVKRL